MKIRCTFKDPDALFHGVVIDAKVPEDSVVYEKLCSLTSKWLVGGEYITVEFDTKAQTCVVVEKNQ